MTILATLGVLASLFFPVTRTNLSTVSGSVLVRVVNGYASHRGVDVTIDGNLVQPTGNVTAFGVGAVSDYVRYRTPRTVLVSVRGSRLTAKAEIPALDAFQLTVVVIGAAPNPPTVSVVADQPNCPNFGHAAVRLLNGSAQVVDAALLARRTTQDPTASQVGPRAESGMAATYVDLMRGGYELQAADGRTGAHIGESRSTSFDPGSAYTVVLVGEGEDPFSLIPLLDGKGLVEIPKGPPPSGSAASAGGNSFRLVVMLGLTVAIACRLRRGALALILTGAMVATACTSKPEPEVARSSPPTVTPSPTRPSPPPTSPSTSPSVERTAKPLRSVGDPSEIYLGGSAAIPIRPTGIAGPDPEWGKPGAIDIPLETEHAFWFEGSPKPGLAGPSVIVAHKSLKNKGPGPFASLARVRTSDPIVVHSGRQWLTFAVDRVEWYPKSAFPVDRVYAPVFDAQIRLITCDGDVVAGSFTQNLVVYAHLVSVARRRS